MKFNLTKMADNISKNIFGLNQTTTVDEFVKTLNDRDLINLYGENIDNFDLEKIYDAISQSLWDSGYNADEVVAYLMKYYFGMSNSSIKDSYMEEYPLLYVVSFRNVEKIHMNISRRVFNQPEYTNPNITHLNQIMCNARLKGTIRELEYNNVQTIDDFKMFAIKYQLKHGATGWCQYRHIVDALRVITNDKIKFPMVSYFPWNVIRAMYSDNLIQSNVFTSDTFIDTFIKNENITDAEFIINHEQSLSKVILFNCRRLLNDREFIIIKEKFVDGKSLTAIREAHHGYPSAGRLQQIYVKALHTLRNAAKYGKLITNGFRLVTDNVGDPVIEELFRGPSDEFYTVANLIIPASVGATLPDIYSYISDNPLMYNILMCGYEKGLIKTNQELRVAKTGDVKLFIPATLEDMNLSIRTYNALYRAGINDIATLSTLQYSQLLNVRNLGKKSIKELVDKLALYGIFLKDYDYMEEKK